MRRIIKNVSMIVLLSLLLLMTPGMVLGTETDEGSGTAVTQLELTLDDAVSRALKNSSDLRLADYDIERSEELREKAEDKVKYTPADGSNQEASNAFTSLVQSDITLQMSKKTKSIKEDSIMKSVFDSYTNVLAAQEKVTVAEKALAVADFQRWAAVFGFQVGKVSQNSREVAEIAYKQKEAALRESRVNLDDCYIKLNNLIGLNPGERPLLVDDPQFVPLQVDNLDAEIQRRLEVDPSLWQAERNVEKARLDLDLFNWNGSTPYRVQEIEVEKAEITASNNRKQARQQLYDTYSSIRQLEEQYKTQEQTLKQAEDTLRINQLKYRLGMIPRGDVLSAESQVASARLSLKSMTYQHEALKLSFDKPWA